MDSNPPRGHRDIGRSDVARKSSPSSESPNRWRDLQETNSSAWKQDWQNGARPNITVNQLIGNGKIFLKNQNNPSPLM